MLVSLNISKDSTCVSSRRETLDNSLQNRCTTPSLWQNYETNFEVSMQVCKVRPWNREKETYLHMTDIIPDLARLYCRERTPATDPLSKKLFELHDLPHRLAMSWQPTVARSMVGYATNCVGEKRNKNKQRYTKGWSHMEEEIQGS